MVVKGLKRRYARTDDGSPQGDITAEVNITSNSKMVKLDNLRNLLEAFLELLDLEIKV